MYRILDTIKAYIVKFLTRGNSLYALSLYLIYRNTIPSLGVFFSPKRQAQNQREEKKRKRKRKSTTRGTAKGEKEKTTSRHI
jgi:hypothetical protein